MASSKEKYERKNYYTSLFCIGSHINKELRKTFPDVPQIEWKEIFNFIHKRFTIYEEQKISHPQKDETGRLLSRLQRTHVTKSSLMRLKYISQRTLLNKYHSYKYHNTYEQKQTKIQYQCAF